MKNLSVSLPDSLKTLGERAFKGCAGLEGATLPEGLTEIGERCFENCGLNNFRISSSVKTIGNNAFRGCGSIILAKGSTLEIPEDKWGAEEVIREE